jgi:hypothetical protein
VTGPAASSEQLLVLAILEAIDLDLTQACQVWEEERAGRVGVVSHCPLWAYCFERTIR